MCNTIAYWNFILNEKIDIFQNIVSISLGSALRVFLAETRLTVYRQHQYWCGGNCRSLLVAYIRANCHFDWTLDFKNPDRMKIPHRKWRYLYNALNPLSAIENGLKKGRDLFVSVVFKMIKNDEKFEKIEKIILKRY